MLKKLTALVFCILLIASFCMPVYAAQDSFAFIAVNANSVIIEPIFIPYTKDQSVREALMATEYKFLGIEQGFISEIEGVEAQFNAFCNIEDVLSPLDASAEEVTVVCYHVASEYSEKLCELIIRMAEFNEMGNVTKYPAAVTAYEDALTAVRTGNGATEALDRLNKAIKEYEDVFGGEKYTVTINALKGVDTLKSPEVTFTDSYGNVTSVKGTEIDVIAGEYDFVVSDGGYNRTEGTLTVSADTQFTVNLPATEWFGEIKLLDKQKGEPYVYTQNTAEHTATYHIHDTAKETGSIYLNVLPGDGVDIDKVKLKTIYEGFNGVIYSEMTRSWESTSTALTHLVSQNMQGRVFDLEAQYIDENGYKQIQSYEMTIIRVPTLRTLTVNAEGTILPMDFDPTVTEYNFVTVSDNVDISAEAFGKDYSVSGTGNIKINSASVSHKITVSSDGQENVYTLNFTKVASVPVTVAVPDGANASVINGAGSVISPVDGVYNLVAGEKYTVRSVTDKYYFAEKTFTASENLAVDAPKPNTDAWLKNIAIYNGSSAKTRELYHSDREFNSSVHEYVYTVPDMNTTAYIQATSEQTVTALYNKQTTDPLTHNTSHSVEIKNNVDSGKSATVIQQVMAKSGYSNEITLRVSKVSGGVTYYQDYIITLARKLHLEELNVYIDSEIQTLLDADGNANEFDRDILNYTVKVNRDEESLTLTGKFPNTQTTTSCCGGYTAIINGESYELIENISVALDPSVDLEVVTIIVRHNDENAQQNVYRLTVEKTDPAYVTFDVNPKEAVIYLENKVNGKRVHGDGNVFALTPGGKYSYTVTSSGYIGTQGEYTASDHKDKDTVKITLKKAPENTELENLQSQWPHLRFNSSNNGVIDTATPIKDDEAMLYWATKIGDGYDKEACGCPILVDGYLYTYSGTKLYKVDTTSGEIVATGAMDKASSFAINPPTYANGMIFVGLADGTVQAFNASTLKSLWIYRDELGGQPNCSIIYHKGFVYTGFWVGETSEANYVCINATDEDPTKEKEEKVATWHYTSDGGFYWAGAYVCDDYLLIGTDDAESGYTRGYARLLSFDTRTGELIDEFKMPVVGDIRSSIVEYEGKFYFTNKGGYFFKATVNPDGTIASVRNLELSNGSDNDATPAMSTCTPTIYNDRAYVGVSGTSQFGAYSGHNITVIDIENWEVAYSVRTQGYPQTSGVLTTHYEEINGCVYVYFFDNYTPGKLRVLEDRPGQIKASTTTVESYVEKGEEKTAITAYNLFTPVGGQAQYAICSPIIDENGTIYFKNDSAYLMAVGSTVKDLEITRNPDKVAYTLGERFDPTGMKITAHYTNGTSKDVTDYVVYSEDPLTENDTDFNIILPYAMYQDADGESGVECDKPFVVLNITVDDPAADIVFGDVDGSGDVKTSDVLLVLKFIGGDTNLDENAEKAADVDGDGSVKTSDVLLVLRFIGGDINSFPAAEK